MSYAVRGGGLRPVKYLNGAAWNGQFRPYVVPVGDATALFVGDPVVIDTTGDASGSTGLPSCIRATAGSNPVTGVVVGFAPIDGSVVLGGDFMSGGSLTLDTPQFRAAATRRIVYVTDDPNLLYEIEEDNSSSLTFQDINLNAAFSLATPGSTTTGQSNCVLNSSTKATTAALNLKIMGLIRRADNDFFSSANNTSTNVFSNPRFLVKINNHSYVSTGVVGV